MSPENPVSLGRPAAAAVMTAVALGIAVPFVAHALPWPYAVPLGAVWLPAFYVPAFCASRRRILEAAAASAVSPSMNFVLTGRPEIAHALTLTAELVFFSLLLSALSFRRFRFFPWAPLIFVLTRSARLAVTGSAPDSIFYGVFLAGLPGLAALWLIQVFSQKSQRQKEGLF